MEEQDWGLDKTKTTEQLTELKGLVDQCWVERCAIDKINAELKLKEKELAKKEAIIKEVLEAVNIESFNGTDCTYSLKEESGERGPLNDEGWAEFKGWMKAKYPDAYESFFKMHLGSLKAFVKKERGLAAEKGEGLSIPGIPEPQPFKYVKAKAKK